MEEVKEVRGSRSMEPTPRQDPTPALLQLRNVLSVERRSLDRNLKQIDGAASLIAGPVARNWIQEGQALERAIQAVSEAVLDVRSENWSAAENEYETARAEALIVPTVLLPPWLRITGQESPP
jgi:hypothetical protein